MRALANLRVTPGAYRWMCFVVLSLGYFLVVLLRFISAVIAPELTTEFSIGPAELGLLTSLYLWGYAAMQIPTGVLSDTLGVRRSLTIFLLLAAFGTYLFAVAGDYQVSAIGRGIAGVGSGIVLVSTLKFLTQWFRLDEFATLNGILMMIGNLGALMAAAPLAWLVGTTGWRFGCFLLAAMAVLLAVLVFILVRDRPPKASLSGTSGPDKSALEPSNQISTIETIKTVALNRNLWLLAVSAFTIYGATMSIQGLWAVPYLMDVHSLSHQTASNMLTAWAAGAIVGSPFMGYLSDRVLRTRKWMLLGGALLYSLPFLALSLNPAGLPWWSFYGVFFYCGLCGSTFVVTFALVNDIMPRQVAGTALGLFNTWNFVGSAAYQQITGLILAAFPATVGQNALEGYQAVFAFCLGGIWLAALAIWATRESSGRALGDANGARVGLTP